MIFNKDQVESINNKQVTYVKNFALLEREYDFNLISQLLEEHNSVVLTKTNVGNLRDVYQMLEVKNYFKEFQTFFDFFYKLFKYKYDSRDAVELFFSMAAQVGVVHADIEDVFIIGLKGKTIYRIYQEENIDYEISKGDLIFIPNGVSHKVIGLTPRIITSIGYFNNTVEKHILK
tara:strand:- start:1128 stop:1652 length:525 start_codon:yes stop_codon:yes gene_type:complete